MLAPFAFVFVWGMKKLMYLILFAATPLLIQVEWETCASGSNFISTNSSSSLQQHQKAMHAMTNTVMSNVFMRLRWCQRALMCSIVTGSLLAWWECWDTILGVPWLM